MGPQVLWCAYNRCHACATSCEHSCCAVLLCAMCYVFPPICNRYSAEQCEELLRDEAAFKALLREAIKGSPVSDNMLCCGMEWGGVGSGAKV